LNGDSMIFWCSMSSSLVLIRADRCEETAPGTHSEVGA
jgi:hypothetical protein